MSAAISQYAMVPADFLSNPFSQYPTLITSMFMHGGPAISGWKHALPVDIRGQYRRSPRPIRLCFILFPVWSSRRHKPYGGRPIFIYSGGGCQRCHFRYPRGLFGPVPGVRVRTLIFLGFYISMVRIPAIILLGIWILMQVANSVSVGAEGEVAWLAHIGGFAAGAILIKPFQGMLRRRA